MPVRIPARNVAEFVAWGKTRPAVPYGTAGIGSTNHLTGALIGDVFGLRMELVPYRSGGQALSDLMAGNVPVVIDNIVTAAALAQDGRARAIAVTSAERSSLLPDVPTFAESGAPGFDLVSWQAVYAPKGTPKDVIDKLHGEIVKVLRLPEVRSAMDQIGMDPVGSTPQEPHVGAVTMMPPAAFSSLTA